MPIYQVIVLAIVQGLAELLPVSSSAHVVVAEKLMGLDPSSPQMTLLLVMLHTGTMFAVIAYFWRQWMQSYFATVDAFKRFALRLIYATALTGVVGEALIKLVEHTMFRSQLGVAPKAEIEDLFGRLDLVAPALACAGILILIAGLGEKKQDAADAKAEAARAAAASLTRRPSDSVTMRQAGWMGLVQGLCLPFRGF
jgi:undecaprenyl-diphosphatase